MKTLYSSLLRLPFKQKSSHPGTNYEAIQIEI